MRIKKTSQTTPIQAQVVNVNSNSTTDSYSCDYVNNNVGKEVYSTTEQVIGTWIDGKPIYRKVFNITSPQQSNTDYVDVSSLNIETLIHLYGYYNKTGIGKFSIPFTDSSTNYSVIFISYDNKIRGRFGDASYVSDVKVIVEYTKTTD